MLTINDITPDEARAELARRATAMREAARAEQLRRHTMQSIRDTLVAGPGLGRGFSAAPLGVTPRDLPALALKPITGLLAGAPEVIAARPFTTALSGLPGAQLAAFTPPERVRIPIPQPTSSVGQRLGDELATAGGLVDVSAFGSPAKQLIGEVVEKIPVVNRTTLALRRAGRDAPEFAQDVRNAFFNTKRAAGEAFEASTEALSNAHPEQRISLMEPLQNLNRDLIDNPKLAGDIRIAFKRSGNTALADALENPLKAHQLTLQQSQQIKASIKKIPSIATKLQQGKFAQWTDTDMALLDFLDDVKASQLEAFPEFADTLAQYRDVLGKYRAVKGKFKPDTLVRNIQGSFGPESERTVRSLLPAETMRDIGGVRSAIKIGQLARTVGSQALVGAGLGGAGLLIAKALRNR